MPNVSTYIRSEDLSKYLTIHSKGGWAEFIHNALNRNLQGVHDEWDKLEGAGLYKPVKTPHTYKATKSADGSKTFVADSETGLHVIKTPKDAEALLVDKRWAQDGEVLKSQFKLCKIHGTPLDDRGKCLIKGCKYS